LLSIELEEIEKCNIKFKQDDNSFNLVQALVDQELPLEVSNQEIQEWKNFKFEPAEAVIKTVIQCKAPLSIYTLVKDHQNWELQRVLEFMAFI
jgi:TATA-binding protein-associated factor Taf7